MSNEKYKQTIIMITHNLELAKMADRVIKINDGKLCSKLKVINKNKYSKIKCNRKIKLSFIKLVKYAIKNLNNMSLLDDVVSVPRRTMTLFFLIDTSGSMMGNKIGNSKRL